jgi:hypothetical protein
MTSQEFHQFIHSNELYNSDGLLHLELSDGSTHNAVWITSLPELGKSVDGIFNGQPEQEVFYLFNTNSYAVHDISNIRSLVCLQKEYLQVHPVLKSFIKNFKKN